MKSQVNTAWIAAASVLAVVGVFSFSLAYQAQSVVRGFNERTIVEAMNEMEFFKQALKQSLTYSTYQSMYDVAKNGGWAEGVIQEPTRWRYYDDTTKAPSSPELQIKNTISKINNEYLSALKILPEISVPKYEIINSKFVDNSVEVEAKPDSILKIALTDLKISTSFPIKIKVQSKIKKLFEVGYAKFVVFDSVKESIVQASTSMPTSCTQRMESCVCDTGNDPPILSSLSGNKCIPISTFNPQKALPPTNENLCVSDFTSKILQNIDDVRTTDDNDVQVSISTAFLENKWDFSASCTNTGTSNNDNNCCKNWVCPSGYEEDPVNPSQCFRYLPCPSGYTADDGTCTCPNCICVREEAVDVKVKDPETGEEKIVPAVVCKETGPHTVSRKETVPKVCAEWYKTYYNVQCSYDYFARVRSDIEIKDNSVQYPVYDARDGKTDFRNIVLKFFIETGNKLP